MNEPSRKPICEPTKQLDLDAVLPNNLSHINNPVLSNHSNQQESLADQPSIDEEINYPIAASNSSQPTPINLDSSGLRCSSRTEVLNRCGLVYSDTTLMDHDECLTSPQTAHLCLASQQSFSSAHVLFSTICPFGGLSCWVQSLVIKVQVSSTPTVSCHAFAFLAFEPVTSLKAIAEMQVSADSNKTCHAFGTLVHEHQCLNTTQPIFQLIDVSVTYFKLILIVDLFQLKQESVDFSSLNAFSIANLDSVSEGVQPVSLIQRFVSSTIYSKSFELIDVSVPNKNEMCGASQLAGE
jgi:hypothetical protein